MKRTYIMKASCIVSCFIALSLAQLAYGKDGHQDILSHFYRANLLYEKADYEEAIKEYQMILSRGYESSAVYYNLANSYIKNNQLPHGLLNYKKALRLTPRDRDIQANYRYARSLIESNGFDRKPAGIERFGEHIFSLLSLDELTLAASFLYGVLIVLIGLAIVGKFSRRKLIAIGGGVCMLLLLATFVMGYRINRFGKEAVVLEKAQPVRFEPLETATVYFELPAGSSVDILSCKNEWCKIERGDKKKGWVRRQALAVF